MEHLIDGILPAVRCFALWMILLAECFDNDFNKVPNGLIQPLIIEDTHIQCLVPVVQRDEPNAGTVFDALVGDKGDAHAGGD